MDVSIQLLATETHHIESFTRHRLSDRFPDRMHHTLKFQVLVLIEVAGYPLPMLFWRNKRVSPECRSLHQERDACPVLVHDVMRVVRVAVHDGADEAPRSAATNIRNRAE